MQKASFLKTPLNLHLQNFKKFKFKLYYVENLSLEGKHTSDPGEPSHLDLQ